MSENTNGGWIPVSERLPSDRQLVLAIGPDGYMEVTVFRSKSPLYANETFETHNGFRFRGVNHWMPLPDLPK